MSEEEQEVKVSKYNSGVAKLIRLNSLWNDVNTHSRRGLYQKWNEDLDKIWCELSADLKELDDDEEIEDKSKEQKKKRKRKDEKGKKILYFDEESDCIKEFNDRIANQGNFQDTEPEGFAKTPTDTLKKRAEHYKILTEKEIYLRRLENKLGKGTAWDDEDEDEWN